MTRAALFVPVLFLVLVGFGASGYAAAATPSSPPLEPVLRVAADVPQAVLDAQFSGKVVLTVRVTPAGYVDSVRVLSGDARLRNAATAAARWHVYAPQKLSVWTPLTIAINGAVEYEPLSPDVLTMARDAEAAGDWSNALVARTGAFARLGRHPSLSNEWALREQVLRVAQHLKPIPWADGETQGMARGARTQQERTMSRAEHGDLVAIFDTVLRTAPWWGDPYLWRAASLAGCGRSTEAVRSLRFFQLTAPDSAGRWLASTALAQLAAGDSLAASELIKKRAHSFNVDRPGSR